MSICIISTEELFYGTTLSPCTVTGAATLSSFRNSVLS